MRAMVLFSVSFVVVWSGPAWSQPTPKSDSKPAKDASQDPPAATLTRSKLLKVKVTVNFTDVRLGEVLKEFAAQVDMRADAPVMWTYASDFPFAQKVSYSCKEKPLEDALD